MKMNMIEEDKFRRRSALEILCKMLDNWDLVWGDYSSYLAKNNGNEPVKIHEFVAKTAVEYADALIDELER